MAQQLTSINLIAPAFKGLNTDDAALAQDPSFAEVADNAVIDRRGRLAARKGLDVITETKTVLGSDYIYAIHEFRDSSGNEKTFSVGNNKIMSGETTLVDESPGAYTISNDNWKMVNFNDSIYFFQDSQEPLVYSDSSGAVEKMTSVAGSAGMTSSLYGNEVLAAYGRLFTADISGDTSTIYWSDLLQGHVWTGGSSGSLDVTKAWPNGYDEIVALAAHNDYLVIFGKNNILVYSGAESPSSMTLSDTISGVGCVDRDTVQSTGDDLIFLSYSGLGSLGRTIQEKSMPLGNLSAGISKDLVNLIEDESTAFISAYHPEGRFYLVGFVGQSTLYCFDTRAPLEDGSLRATRWPSSNIKSLYSGDRSDNRLLIGGSHGIGTYSTYLDDTSAYRFKYSSPELAFGDPATLKFLKKIRPTMIGGSGQPISLKWAYNFGSSSGSRTITPAASNPTEYNSGEYNEDEYTSGVLVSRESVNTGGSGTTLAISVEADINGTELSIQEINVLALTGRVL
jgi:hypothetical protein